MPSGVEFAGGGQDRVTHGFIIQALAVEAAEQIVLRILGGFFRRGMAALLEGAGGEDQRVQLLQAPAVFHESGGQVVQQICLHGLRGLHAEVTGLGDERLAEMLQPHTVDNDACGERIVLAGDVFRQIQTSAAIGKFFAAKHREPGPRCGIALPRWIAADIDAHVLRLRFVHHHHGARRCTGMGAVDLRALVVEAHHGLAVLAGEERVCTLDRDRHGRKLVLHELAHGLHLAVENDACIGHGDILHRLRRCLRKGGGDLRCAAAFRPGQLLRNGG